MSIHIVLVEPEIPPNTGNIARSCAITNSVLHLVEPLGFSLDEKRMRRAGLDYWQHVDVVLHESLDAFLGEYSGKRMFFATTRGTRRYSDVEYRDGDMILFGKETEGLPRSLIDKNMDMTIRIPMSRSTRLRSLNLSNSVAIVLFKAMETLGYPELE